MRKILQLFLALFFIVGMANLSNAVNVTFRVDMSTQVVDPAGVHIAGSLQGWNPATTALTDAGGGIWEVTLALVTGDYHEYKFINGNAWGQDESVPGGCAAGGNRFITVPATDLILDAICFASCTVCSPPQHNITFQVDMSNEIVSANGVHIAGSMNGWSPSATPMTNIGANVYSVTFILDEGNYYEYKFLNGNAWGTDESVPPSCAVNNNRYYTVPTADATLPLVCFGSCSTCVTVTFVDITFRVDMSNEVVSPNGVHIAGSFQGWNPGSSLMTNVGNGIYEITFTGLQSGSYQEYKYINGNSWGQSESVPAGCNANGNRFFSVPNVNTVRSVVCFAACEPCSAQWTGANSSDWFDAGNWDNGIPGAITNVTIPSTSTNFPTISAGTASCNNILIKSDVSGTSTLLDNGNLTVNGTSSVERFFSGNDPDWHLVSSPVSNATANVFAGMYLQSFDNTTYTYTDVTNALAPLNVMQGYAAYSNLGATNTVTFSGNLNTGTLSYSAGLGADAQGWNLLGNPFASSIDIESIVFPSGMSHELHYVDAATGGDLSYVQGTGGTGSRYTAPNQGFFVSVTAPGNLILGDAQRTHTGPGTFYKSDNPKLLILEASNNSFSDQTWIHFNDNAGVEHDGQFDAYKRISTSNPELPQIYSYTANGSQLSINGLPEVTNVPVGFTSLQSGVFEISVIESGEFSNVILEDVLTQTQTDLLNNSYTFNYTVGDQENRFIVHFSPLAVPQSFEESVNIFSFNSNVYVNVPSNTQGEINIYNLMGQEVLRQDISDTRNIITLDQNSYYIVKVISNKGVAAKKVLIK